MLFAGLASSVLGKTVPEILTEYGRTENQEATVFAGYDVFCVEF